MQLQLPIHIRDVKEAETIARASSREWRRAGSNRRPSGCKPDALPAELRPRRGALERVSGPGLI